MSRVDRTSLPTITIVTPSYNQGRFIAETIESIAAQEYPNLQYLVVDGGSTDESVSVIKEHSQHISWWVSEPDKGQSDAINKGLARADGELFAWVNSDDVLFPGCLHAIASHYISSGRPDLITSDVCYMDKGGHLTRYVRLPRQSRFLFFRGVWHVSAPVVFFRTAMVKALGGVNVDLHMSMDLDLWVRMMRAGARIEHVQAYLGGFRWHDASKTMVRVEVDGSRWGDENRDIWKRYAPSIDERSARKWGIAYKLYQILNGNYALAYLHFLRHGRGRHWTEAGVPAIRPEASR